MLLVYHVDVVNNPVINPGSLGQMRAHFCSSVGGSEDGCSNGPNIKANRPKLLSNACDVRPIWHATIKANRLWKTTTNSAESGLRCINPNLCFPQSIVSKLTAQPLGTHARKTINKDQWTIHQHLQLEIPESTAQGHGPNLENEDCATLFTYTLLNICLKLDYLDDFLMRFLKDFLEKWKIMPYITICQKIRTH